jgi:hypothetical protein
VATHARVGNVRGLLCPVCVRPTRAGSCEAHGLWEPHQLLTRFDRGLASRRSWLPFDPLIHACPRCLGQVVPSRAGFECAAHHHGSQMHGPFQVDELLAPTAQREAAIARERLARARVRAQPTPFALELPALPSVANAARVVTAGALIAATLAFLTR